MDHVKVIIAIPTTENDGQRLCFSYFSDIISKSKTRAQKRDQKTQLEACLLSAVHTVHTTRRQKHPKRRKSQNHQKVICELQKKRR